MFFLTFIETFLSGMEKENKICRNQAGKIKVPFVMILFNIVFLLPVLAAPFVALTSAFLFDNPSNFLLTALIALALNSYSFILIGAVYWSIRLYKKGYKLRMVLCPQLISGLIIWPPFLYMVIRLIY